MIKRQITALTTLILFLVAMVLLVTSLYSVIVKENWNEGTYFLLAAFCIYPYDHKKGVKE